MCIHVCVCVCVCVCETVFVSVSVPVFHDITVQPQAILKFVYVDSLFALLLYNPSDTLLLFDCLYLN